MAALLLVRAPVDEGRAEQRNAEAGERNGSAGTFEFLLVDDALEQGCAAAAVFPRPAKPDPAALVELAMPSDARVPLVVGFIGQRLSGGGGVLAVFFQPGAKFGSKRLVFGAVVEVHCGLLPPCAACRAASKNSYHRRRFKARLQQAQRHFVRTPCPRHGGGSESILAHNHRTSQSRRFSSLQMPSKAQPIDILGPIAEKEPILWGHTGSEI